MSYIQPWIRRYSGRVILGPQPKNWIARHRSFASKEWIESQVRFGEWTKERNKPHNFLIYAIVLEGIKPLKILIKITHSPQGNIRYLYDHVFVYHTHVLRQR